MSTGTGVRPGDGAHDAPLAEEALASESPAPRVTLEDHLPSEHLSSGEDTLAHASRPPHAIAAGGVRVATALRREGREVVVRLRGRAGETRVLLDPEVDAEVIDDAIARGDGVLVEVVDGEQPLVIGAIARRRPAATVLRGTSVTIEAADEVLLRAGHSALRLRSDGDIELVGSRISATSRGLFRLIGRVLRLN